MGAGGHRPCAGAGTRAARVAYHWGVAPPRPAPWLYALKPASWPKLLVPALLGQAMGVAAHGSVRADGLVAGFAHALGLLACMVLLNDWGDQEVDALKRRLFAETCSPKTIPDGILRARDVLYAGLGAGAGALGVAVWAELFMDRPGAAALGLAGLALFAAYSLPPLRLNYRGGGELLEMAGVGLVLPLWNCYVQSGILWPRSAPVLAPFAALALASALASGLADEHSDRLGGKVTFTTMFGNAPVRHAVVALVALAGLGWGGLAARAPAVLDPRTALAACLVLALHGGRLARISPRARSDAPQAIRVFKLHLHRAIWWSALVVAAGIVLAS